TADIRQPLNAEINRVLAMTNAALASLRWNTRLLEFTATVADDHLQADYPFMNMGSRTVNLLSVTSTCACISGVADATNYPPHQGGVVRVEFVFGPRVGPQSKYVVVRTDDPSEPEVRLQMDVRIPEVIRIEPSFAYWQAGATPTASVHRLSLVQPGCTVVGLVASNSTFQTQLLTNSPGQCYELRVVPTSTTRRAFERLDVLVAVASNVTRRFPLFVAVDLAKPPVPE
ncbi:MAG: DUF1573 domain-containing protein, partial [Kiritimatiellaeota bacterium]|nr:DUF1573 domain-containing protein [Kiritimatiellota bacterium]